MQQSTIQITFLYGFIRDKKKKGGYGYNPRPLSGTVIITIS